MRNDKGHFSLLIKEILKFYLPSLLIVLLIITVHYTVEVRSKQENLLSNEYVTVELTQQLIGSSLNTMTADAKMLAYYTGSISDLSKPDFEQKLSRYFSLQSELSGNYDQIRFIDKSGMEIVRTENVAGEIRQVATANLQNKGHRYYFINTMSQDMGQVYISPLDLNVENGIVVEPYQPTIRIGIKVFANDSTLLGILVVNYQASRLINTLKTLSPSFNDHLILITPQGYSLIQSDKEKLLTYNLDNTFSKQYPNLWLLTQKQKEGQLNYQGSYFTYAHIDAVGTQGVWTVISYLEKNKLQRIDSLFTQTNLFLYSSLALLLLFFSVFTGRSRLKQKHTENQKNYEQNFRFILKNIQQVAVTVSQSGEVIFCNDAFVNMVKSSREQIIGTDWIASFIPQELRSEVKKALQSKFITEQVQDKSEGVVMTTTGEARLVLWSSSFTNNPDELMQAVTFVGEDITESAIAKDKLRQLSHAVEQSPSAVMVTNLEGKIIYVNPIFSEVTGYQSEEVLGRFPSFLQSGMLGKQDYRDMWRIIKNGKQWQGEFHNRKKNGELYWESARISPVQDVNGNNLYYVAVKQDITEQKELEAQLAQQTTENLKNEKMASVGRVANMIAHDLRNPLSSIKMSLQMATRQNNPKFQELFQLSLEQVKYMESILEDLMSYSRPNQLKPEWLDINDLIEPVLLSCQKQIKESGVEIQTKYQLNLPTLNCDKTKIRQVIQNLLVNAIQAAEDDHSPTVIISTNLVITENNTNICLQINNNGKSIDPCIKGKAFEAFFTTKARGTGLGLAIVKRVIEQHQGSITLEPINSGGTQATILIPTMPAF